MSQPRPRPCFASTALEGAQLADAHEVEQLLARVREVLAEVVVDRHALARQLRLQHLRDERHAAAAGAAGLGLALELRPPSCSPRRRRAQIAPLLTLLHEQICAVSGSASGPPSAGAAAAGGLRHEQLFRKLRQRHVVQHHLQPGAVVAGVAHHHAAEHALAVGIDDQLLVDLLDARR